jgi:hypothetical protein
MKESILHYVWQNRLFTDHDLKTTAGEKLDVIDVGRINTDAGPDFFNAKIRIGETLWAGNVEIHTCSTEWYKHNHQSDNAYDSVILHVVLHADCEIYRGDGDCIPQLELNYPTRIETNYDQLLSEQKWIPCSDKINLVPSIFIQSWKSALLTERLEQKMNSIEQLLLENNQYWEDAFYITLARNFGFGTNSQVFEGLAKSLSISVLGKHKDNLLQLEALMFGQAGLLNPDKQDDYCVTLKREYDFLRVKYGLNPLTCSQWKLLRLRPDNFPHVRIAQFAALIHTSTKLFSKIVEDPEIESLRKLFETKPSQYWESRYLFANESPLHVKKLGAQSINGIIINTVVPFLFCYADHKNNEALKSKALLMLEKIQAEKNSILTGWNKLGIIAETAFDSQALIQLKKQYCDEKKCLRCRIGHKVLTLQPAE